MINPNRLNKDVDYDVTINAGATKYYAFLEDTDTDDYTPFHNLTVFNTGNQAIKVFLNGASGSRLIPAGTIAKMENKLISNLKIINEGAVQATFTLNLNNDVSDNEYLQAIYEGK